MEGLSFPRKKDDRGSIGFVCGKNRICGNATWKI